MIALLRVSRLWSLLCVLCVAAWGCGGEPEATPAADLPSEEVKAPAFDAPLTTGLPLPEDFPDDVPSYPGSEVTGVESAAGGGLLVSFTTSDSPETVSENLEKAFSEKGWSAEGRKAGSAASMVSAEKGGRSATLFITEQEGETRVDLFLVPSG